MPVTRGKQFEERFKQDWVRTFPNGECVRLPDQVSGYKYTSQNICDFICYNYPNLFYIECKTHKKASIPLDNITQYERLIEHSGKQGVRSGVVIWLYDKDRVFYVPASTIKKMKEDGKKSIGLTSFDEYDIIDLPSRKLRVFMETDYSCMMNLKEGE